MADQQDSGLPAGWVFVDEPPMAVSHEQPGSSSALALQGAARAIPAAERLVETALNAPNAPRIIQRAIGAGVRGASTAAGAAVGGVPGAVAGAAMSEGLTPTQQTIRGWLGRTATRAAESAAPAGDAVVNYIEAMGANPNNLTGAALEYAKKAGRAVIYDAGGTARLVPAKAIASQAPQAVATPSWFLGKAARTLSALSGAQGALDLAQMADPDRKDIGFLGIGATQPPLSGEPPAAINGALAAIAERMGRPDLAAKFRGR